jgi:hypothetical protein
MDAKSVPASLHEGVMYDLGQASQLLRLPLKLRWWSGDSSNGAVGWVSEERPDTVNLSLAYALEAGEKPLRALIYHEAKHAWQLHRRPWLTKQQAEQNANEFCMRELGFLPEILMDWEV